MSEPTVKEQARIVADRLYQQSRKVPSEKEKFRILTMRLKREAEASRTQQEVTPPTIIGGQRSSHGEAV